jgi:hypothetical protein
MHRTLLALVILLRLATAPFARADEPAADAPSLAAAAARAAQSVAADPPASRRAMNRGTMWAGIGMLGLSAPIALSATIGDCLAPADRCRDQRHAAYAAAGVLAAEGATLLTIAHVQRLGPEPDPNRKRMRPGLKWTGIGLLTGSVMTWAASEQSNCWGTSSCNDRQRAHHWIAGAMAGAGATVLATGFATRRTSWPAVVIQGDRAMLQQRVTF